MILVWDIFQLKFGKAKEAVTLMKHAMTTLQKAGHQPMRLLTDLTGPYYTLVLESSFKSLAEFEQGHSSTRQSPEWKTLYQQFVLLVESGRREIFTIVE
ncbi:MAG: NIPSNAP family protein [Candidatus Zixiibacteriota bacterium]